MAYSPRWKTRDIAILIVALLVLGAAIGVTAADMSTHLKPASATFHTTSVHTSSRATTTSTSNNAKTSYHASSSRSSMTYHTTQQSGGDGGD